MVCIGIAGLILLHIMDIVALNMASSDVFVSNSHRIILSSNLLANDGPMINAH